MHGIGQREIPGEITIPICQYLGRTDNGVRGYMLIPNTIRMVTLIGDWGRYGSYCGSSDPSSEIPADDYPLTNCAFEFKP